MDIQHLQNGVMCPVCCNKINSTIVNLKKWVEFQWLFQVRTFWGIISQVLSRFKNYEMSFQNYILYILDFRLKDPVDKIITIF